MDIVRTGRSWVCISFCMGAYFFFWQLIYVINLEGHKKLTRSEHFQGNSLKNAIVMGEVYEVSN